jgi:hypothetical protein
MEGWSELPGVLGWEDKHQVLLSYHGLPKATLGTDLAIGDLWGGELQKHR